jgi:hypothetical protein
MDSLTISDRSLIDEFEVVAKERDIPCQLSILPRGGTDAGPMQRARGGFRTMTLSGPDALHPHGDRVHPQARPASRNRPAGGVVGGVSAARGAAERPPHGGRRSSALRGANEPTGGQW